MVDSLLIALNFLSLVAGIIPLAWHIKNKNVAAIGLIFWISVMNIDNFVSSIAWGSPDLEKAWDGKIYCDIFVKLDTGSMAGIFGCVAAICRNLSIIMSKKGLFYYSEVAPWKKISIELFFCFGTSIICMILSFLAQPNRYGIAPFTGCTVFVDQSSPLVILYVLVWIWALIATYYAILTIVRFFLRRNDFEEIGRSSHSGLSTSRFLRLLVFSVFIILAMIPLSAYSTIFIFRGAHLKPWSWERVHGPGWGQILFLPPTDNIKHWIIMALGFWEFFFFGLGADATRMYGSWFRKLHLGRLFPDSCKRYIPSSFRNQRKGNGNSSFTTPNGTSWSTTASNPKGDCCMEWDTESGNDDYSAFDNQGEASDHVFAKDDDVISLRNMFMTSMGKRSFDDSSSPRLTKGVRSFNSENKKDQFDVNIRPLDSPARAPSFLSRISQEFPCHDNSDSSCPEQYKSNFTNVIGDGGTYSANVRSGSQVQLDPNDHQDEHNDGVIVKTRYDFIIEN